MDVVVSGGWFSARHDVDALRDWRGAKLAARMAAAYQVAVERDGRLSAAERAALVDVAVQLE